MSEVTVEAEHLAPDCRALMPQPSSQPELVPEPVEEHYTILTPAEQLPLRH